MASSAHIAAIEACIGNRLDAAAIGNRRIAGVIGDAPSHYSKSPALWNAAFKLLQMDATYLPFDVEASRLKNIAAALRNCERVLGVNVTVPHKRAIMDYLDHIDAAAERVRAVNTIVRAADGQLTGYNTDGEGFIESISKPQPGARGAFMGSLDGKDVLLLGAGGSARAVGFHVARLLSRGTLSICNRSVAPARALAADLRADGYNARALGEAELHDALRGVALIVNSTTKGQAGLRRLDSGKIITLQPYSALAPANPTPFDADGDERALKALLLAASQADVRENNDAALKLVASLPREVRFYDLIYAPEETVFLRHARETGHPTMNGKSMIVNQAAIAFCRHICAGELKTRGTDPGEAQKQITEAMYKAW